MIASNERKLLQTSRAARARCLYGKSRGLITVSFCLEMAEFEEASD